MDNLSGMRSKNGAKCITSANKRILRIRYLLSISAITGLLVQRLGVSGGGGDVSVTGSLVRAGGLLQRLSVGEVGVTSGVVGCGVAGDEVESEKREHCDVT